MHTPPLWSLHMSHHPHAVPNKHHTHTHTHSLTLLSAPSRACTHAATGLWVRPPPPPGVHMVWRHPSRCHPGMHVHSDALGDTLSISGELTTVCAQHDAMGVVVVSVPVGTPMHAPMSWSLHACTRKSHTRHTVTCTTTHTLTRTLSFYSTGSNVLVRTHHVCTHANTCTCTHALTHAHAHAGDIYLVFFISVSAFISLSNVSQYTFLSASHVIRVVLFDEHRFLPASQWAY